MTEGILYKKTKAEIEKKENNRLWGRASTENGKEEK